MTGRKRKSFVLSVFIENNSVYSNIMISIALIKNSYKLAIGKLFVFEYT